MSPREDPPTGARRGRSRSSFLKDLRLGARLSLRGGREVVARTLLTALGVGIATAALLLAASLPVILDNLGERNADRMDYQVADYPPPPAGDDTLLFKVTDTQYENSMIRGRLLRAEGDDPPLPPGVETFPGPGEIVLSPALAELLDDPERSALRRGYDHTVIGEIGPEGLVGPRELAYYLGDDDLTLDDGAGRLPGFGGEQGSSDEPVILLLGVVGVVVMLTPVVVFLGAAVRFGGEKRDRRLAALRLMGADRGATRRIAAGETLPGIALGLVLGAGLFLAGRPIVETVPVSSGLYTADVLPHPVLALLVLLGVPLLALWVVLVSLNRVVIEPLGTVRRAERRRPRLWWRLLLFVTGIALILLSMRIDLGGVGWAPLMATGLLAALFGTTAVLPWLLDRLFGRASGGPLSLQLALRRLAAAGDGPVRAVAGIVVTVAGAIALQSLYAGAWEEFTVFRAESIEEAYEEMEFGAAGYQLQAGLKKAPSDPEVDDLVAEVPGLEKALAYEETWGVTAEGSDARIVIADCPSLRQMADLPECSPGDVFGDVAGVEAGDTLLVGAGEEIEPAEWMVPHLTGFEGPPLEHHWYTSEPPAPNVVLATPEAMGLPEGLSVRGALWLRVDPSVPEMREELQGSIRALDPASSLIFPVAFVADPDMIDMRDALIAGALACLSMIAAGLVVGTIEQVRERKRVHAVLTAFGTRRRTLIASVLWQTTLPVLLGIALAAVAGTTLGALALIAVDIPVTFAPVDILIITGAGVVVATLTTLLAIPALLRTMSPEGLRSE
ncbi:FtsX-like permease family protein [Nocardiopsis alba]|uniref:FtsX-like permease family protein n=1 Tax=Nocardiopsis alba (strain ATCC BAA-2165 / BE74) TaxID=1205910 RepID=J7L8E0_NOCAA|nr:ABC transporter permease [Nocardiopsis alba]AFR06737.1 ftsX-like permease family protein [Nocardiopsis alba ATCC BAA-2165]